MKISSFHVPVVLRPSRPTSYGLIIFVLATLVAAGCIKRQSRNVFSEEQVSTETYESSVYTQIQTVCAGQSPEERLMTSAVIECSCVQNGRRYMWYNAVLPGGDPSANCRPANLVFDCKLNPDGICEHPGLLPMPESSMIEQPNPSMSAPQAPPSAAVTVPPTHWVPPATSASPPPAKPPAKKPPAQIATETRELNYECTAGSSAIRNYVIVTGRNGVTSAVSVQQQCVGPSTVCLTKVTDKADTAKPPCTCSGGQAPKILSKDLNTWSCDEDKAAP